MPLSAGRARLVWIVGGAVLLLAVLVGGLAVTLWPVIQERDRAVAAFFDAYREGDDETVESLTARKAKIDDALLRREVPKSETFEALDDVIGFDGTSCVRGVLRPNDVQITLFLVEDDPEWKVRRAGRNDDECYDRLEP